MYGEVAIRWRSSISDGCLVYHDVRMFSVQTIPFLVRYCRMSIG